MSKTISEIVLEQRQKLDIQSKKQELNNLERILDMNLRMDYTNWEDYQKNKENLNDKDNEIDLELEHNIRKELKEHGGLVSFDSLYQQNSRFRSQVVCTWDDVWKIYDKTSL